MNLIHGNRILRVEGGFSNKLYLPYSGNDVEAIMRLFKGFCLLMFPQFIINNNNLDAIKTLAEITSGKKEKTGLVLRGGIGVGKTTLIKLWIKFRESIVGWKARNEITENLFDNLRPNVVMLNPIKLISNFTKNGYLYFDDLSIGNIMLVDDLAAVEPISYFGNHVNLMEKLICTIYDKTKTNSDFELYATTDVTSTQLTDIIGQRAASRLAEMAYWKEGLIKGTDMRISNDSSRLMWPTK